MQYNLDTSASPSSNKSDCIVVAVFSNKKDKAKSILSEAANELDMKSDGALKDVIESGDFKASLEQTQMLYNVNGLETSRVLMVGCGEEDSFNTIALSKVVKAASKAIKLANIESVSFYLADSFDQSNIAQAATQIVISHGDNDYQLLDYKSEEKNESKLKNVNIAMFNIDKSSKSELKTAIVNGAAIVEGMTLAKDLANHPGNVCTPTYIAIKQK